MSRTVNSVLIAVSVVAAATIGFGAYRAIQVRPVTVSPAPPPDSPPSQVAAATTAVPVPVTRPVFSLADRDGKKRSITEWDGKTLVVNFWATWCPPCRREIPMLKALSAGRAAQEVVVIGVAVDFRDQVLAYADKEGINYPLLIGEDDGLDAATAFGLGSMGLPFTVFIDNRGRIVTIHLGELHAEQANLIVDTVLDVNSGTLTIEQAKERIAAGMNAMESKKG
jgi:thiol-disulfide isomerase/thioredoxin